MSVILIRYIYFRIIIIHILHSSKHVMTLKTGVGGCHANQLGAANRYEQINLWHSFTTVAI